MRERGGWERKRRQLRSVKELLGGIGGKRQNVEGKGKTRIVDRRRKSYEKVRKEQGK